jgi:hypothetical protein
MRDRLAALHDVRNDVLAEVAAGLRIGGVAAQQFHQELGMEDVDPHRGQRQIGIARDAWRICRLFDEVNDAVGRIDMHDAEAGRFHTRHFQAADGHVST